MRMDKKLYEAGYITYMRTDSVNLSKQALVYLATMVEKEFGRQNLKTRQYKTKSKNAQEAHEAIRPTNMVLKSAGRTREEKKLYALIWKRVITSQMADAKITRTKMSANPNISAKPETDIPEFTINGSVIALPGWLLADEESRGEERELPKVDKGNNLFLKKIRKEEKETEPPHRYSEAGLVKELEKRGIGRPSTYASIIKTILDREYAVKENRALRPTELGEIVSSFLEEHFGNYISDTFTAEMEDELDDISLGKRTYQKTLKDFYGPFSKEVASKKNVAKINDLGDAPKDIKCPVCGGGMKIKLGRGGKFYSCRGFPDCSGAFTLDGKQLEGPKETGEKCPQCQTGKLVEREGRYGKFIACSNYPKCRYVKKDKNNGNSNNDTGAACPLCKEGAMREKRGRFGLFYGCSNYPQCKNITKSKPTGNICHLCGSLMMEGTKTIPERCSNKNCLNHNPHKIKK